MRPSILVFRVGQLGDSLISLPAISFIKHRHPQHSLILLTDRYLDNTTYVSSWNVFESSHWFEEVFFYEPELPFFRRLRQITSVVRKLRKKRLQHVYCLAPVRSPIQRIRDKLLFKYLVGTTHYHAELSPPNRREPYSLQQRVLPEWVRLLRIVASNASPESPPDFRLNIPRAEQEFANRLLEELGVSQAQLLIAICPGSKMPAKQWPEERFREAGELLLERFKNSILLNMGSAPERDLGERLCSAWGPRSRNLAGRLTVYGSAAALARCAVFVGNDTGAMHLAAMVGTPCVAIFSARDRPGKWDPMGTNNLVLREQTECAGCMLETCVQERKKCLTAISVHSVVCATERVLAGSRESKTAGNTLLARPT
jgi:heptosyltransferase-3